MTILHVDMDAYFAAVEQKLNPELRGKPIIVCGTGRTVVATASYEARKYGIKTAMTVPQAKKLCPFVIAVHGNHERYIGTAMAIHKIFLEFTDQVEVFSIDECFLDVTNSQKLFGDGLAIAKKIKQRIKEKIGLTCSVGIAKNKLLAKLASGMQKPDGLVAIKENDAAKIFENLPIQDLCGIGPKITNQLNLLGIRTAKQLGNAPIKLLKEQFGVLGDVLKQMGNGIDESEVASYFHEREAKSIGHSHTLEKDTSNLNVINSYIRMLSERVGERLRKEKMLGKTVALTLRYCDFYTFSRHKTLAHYIRTGHEIYSTASEIFKKVLPLKKEIRLIGVTISNLVSGSVQEFLFEEMQKEFNFTNAVDKINSKYGEYTIKPLSVNIAEKYETANRRTAVHGFISCK